MDHIRILRRAFDITRLYRALWVFGVLVALTTARGSGGGGGGGGSNGSNGSNGGFPPDFQWRRDLPNLDLPRIGNVEWSTVAGIVIALVCLSLVIGVGFAILRYVSTTALVRMVDGYENTGEKVSVREGFRLGWNRRSWRLFLIDLLFGLLALLVLILGLAIAAAPLLLLLTQSELLSAIGGLTTVGLGMLFLLAFILAAIALRLAVQFFQRAVIIENLGVMDAIRRGWKVATRRLGDTVIMALILFGINLGFTLLMIPVVIVLLLVAGVTGGLPGLLAGGVTSLFSGDPTAVLVGVLVALPIFLLVFVLPLLFIGGLFETFYSSTWTLTYRELVALESGITPVEPPAPAPDEPASSPEPEPPAAG